MEKRATPFDAYGVECGKGWEKLYKPLIERCHAEGVAIAQIKEKFGGLRFYIGPTDKDTEVLRAAIWAAEERSFEVCEQCGAEGVDVSTRGPGWIQTLCASCRARFEEKRAQEAAADAAIREASGGHHG